MSLDQAKNEENEGLLRSGNPALVIVSDGTNCCHEHLDRFRYAAVDWQNSMLSLSLE
jgi:hypothetical protein